MKSAKIYLPLVIFLASLLAWTLTSCSSDEPNDIIWDIAPMCFKIEVEDHSGAVIDYKSEQWTKLLESISILYDGTTYTPREDTGLPSGFEPNNAMPQSREILPIFKGLYYNLNENYMGKNVGVLYFGEFARDEDYTIEFKVNWPDGSSSDVKFENKCKWKNNEPKISSILWIDGKKQQDKYLLRHKLTR